MNERRGEIRREDDMSVISRVDALSVRLDNHIDRMTEFETQTLTRWDELVEILEGREVKHLDGSRTREGGLLRDVESITHQLANGGVRVRLPIMAWVAIWAAVISGLFQVASSAIGG